MRGAARSARPRRGTPEWRASTRDGFVLERRPFPSRPPSLETHSASRAVSRPRMAVETVELSTLGSGAPQYGMDEVRMAPHTVGLDESSITRGDLDGLLEVLQGEGSGVAKAVVRLGDPLGEACVGQVALDASGHMPVPALEPRVVLRVHDVAVGARARVGGEVGEALGVDEGERTDPRGDSHETGREHEQA